MRRRILALVLLGPTSVIACGLTLFGMPTPTATPTLTSSPTLIAPSATLLPSSTLPATATGPAPAPATSTSSSGSSGIIPGSPSGPYAVILVTPGDVLNIRSGPGVGYSIVGSFPPSYTSANRTGLSSKVGESLWVEVQNPSGGKGWVNSKFLTEYVPSTTFCADSKVTTLLGSFKTAVVTSDGELLVALVSPSRGMDVRYVRDGRVVNYDPEHAEFIFETTFQVDWGLAPGSGLDVKGSFQDVIVPDLLKVFTKNYTLHCNELKYGGVTYQPAWPYPSTNFYSAFFAGTAENGNLDWHTWVIGVEYAGGKPYIFALMQFFWEP